MGKVAGQYAPTHVALYAFLTMRAAPGEASWRRKPYLRPPIPVR
jgi:hypothetical protein